MERTPLRRARVAAEIRAELARQNKSKASLAQAAGISPDTLRRRLNGVYPFAIEEVDAICFFLGIPIAEFVARARADAHV